MTTHTPITWDNGLKVDQTHLNEQIRDNMTELLKGTQTGDITCVSTSTDMLEAIHPSGDNKVLMSTSSSSVPTYGYNFIFSGSPLTNPNYDGDTVTAGSAILTANDWGVPEDARAILTSLSVRWTSGGTSNWINLRPTGSNDWCLGVAFTATNGTVNNQGIIPLDSNGQFEYFCAYGADQVTINIWGYIL